ncbi:MAG: hypothetical protein AUJ12_06135 [Alphaproteobacteria bacterium CG1_02_46_17]|nr:MAG: hypothetical protein AUJ12_06135 [Alphaproteobacteria bacterium CG1_02_46_17]
MKGIERLTLKVNFLLALIVLLPTSVQASNKVSSPDVTKDKVELEYRGGYDIDEDDNKDGNQLHKFVANYGLTDRWRMETKGILAESSKGYDWTALEWSNRFQILKGDEGLPKLSIQGNYKFSLQSGKPDKFEATVLMSKDMGSLTHVTNINFENEVGSYAKDGTDFNVRWKTKYRYRPSFEPGVELFMDFGKFGTETSGPRKYQ